VRLTPNANTVRVRIAAIPPRERLGRRSHCKAAIDQFAPRPGVFDTEIERWLTEYIVGVYHAKQHGGIQTSPLQRWTAGVIGDPETDGPSRNSGDPVTSNASGFSAVR
jgi:hypothetical protein